MVILTDELRAIAQEIIRGDYLDQVHIGLDFFDASINRVAAWIIDTRCILFTMLNESFGHVFESFRHFSHEAGMLWTFVWCRIIV